MTSLTVYLDNLNPFCPIIYIYTLKLVNAGTCILRPTCLLRPNIKVPIYTCIHDTKLDTKTTCPLRPF